MLHVIVHCCLLSICHIYSRVWKTQIRLAHRCQASIADVSFCYLGPNAYRLLKELCASCSGCKTPELQRCLGPYCAKGNVIW